MASVPLQLTVTEVTLVMYRFAGESIWTDGSTVSTLNVTDVTALLAGIVGRPD